MIKTLTAIKYTSEDKAVVISACLGGLFDGFDASIYVLVLFPAISELIHSTSHEQVGPIGAAVLAIFMLGWALGAIVFGHVCDRIGTVRTMTYTILLYAISTGLCAISHSWQELAFYRFLAGCGIGGEQGAGAILLSERFKHIKSDQRYFLLGLMTASIAAGYWLSSLVNFGLGHIGWRYVFLCGLAPALLALYIRSKLHQSAHKDHLIHERGSLLSTIKAMTQSHFQKTITILAMSIAAIVNWWAVLSWIPAWVNQLTGQLAVEERSITAFVTYTGTFLAAITGVILLSKLGRRRALAIAFAGSLIADIVMFLSVKCFGLPLLCLAFAAGAFAALPFLYLFILVPELFPAGMRGTAFGVSLQTGRIFAAIGAIAGGQIIHSFHGSYAIAGSCVALVNVIGIIAAVFIPKHENFLVEESRILERQKMDDKNAELVSSR